MQESATQGDPSEKKRRNNLKLVVDEVEDKIGKDESGGLGLLRELSSSNAEEAEEMASSLCRERSLRRCHSPSRDIRKMELPPLRERISSTSCRRNSSASSDGSLFIKSPRQDVAQLLKVPVQDGGSSTDSNDLDMGLGGWSDGDQEVSQKASLRGLKGGMSRGDSIKSTGTGIECPPHEALKESYSHGTKQARGRRNVKSVRLNLGRLPSVSSSPNLPTYLDGETIPKSPQRFKRVSRGRINTQIF